MRDIERNKEILSQITPVGKGAESDEMKP